ncbi:MAG: ABC transporter substrate-binding protein [Pseudomonadota bacterium]
MISPLRCLSIALLALGLISCKPAAAPAKASQRVITLAPHLAELVCAAAGCEMLVAVTSYSDFPPEITRLPVVGDVAQVNLEAVLALQPTQVIVWEGGTPAAQRARLHTVKLPVTALRIEHLEDVADALVQLGTLLGTPQRAQAAAADYRQRLSALRVAHQGARPVRVLYQIATAPVYSINRLSPISEAISLCGGTNVFADLPTIAAPVTDEAVLAARAQVVIHGPDSTAAVAAYWARFTQASETPPTLVAIDSDLLARAGPRLIEGVEQLCAALERVRHPATALPTP